MLVTMLNFASHKILTTLDLNTALLFCKICGRTAAARSAVFLAADSSSSSPNVVVVCLFVVCDQVE